MPTPARCKSCSAPIYWVKTHTGRRMPVDATPTGNGNMVLASVGGQLKSEPHDWREPSHAPPRQRWVSHFVTCPQRGEWRRAP